MRRAWAALTAAACSTLVQPFRVPGRAPRGLAWDNHGRLGFAQTETQPSRGRSAQWTSHAELYPVEVNFDLQAMDAATGVSMVFDKKRQLMRLEQGITPGEAKIFATSAGSINGLYDMRALMSRNAYPDAGAIPNEPGHEISARMDLSQSQPLPNGGIDAKVTSRCLAKHLQAQATSGPSHGKQRPFRWRSSDGAELWPGWPHVGLPDVWDFGFVQLSPGGFEDLVDAAAC
mmetsp:Transcript_54025/g.168726  ORF Transcript_54025/g.168726 Transcript_54025/m.168726 type:complete len:231 (-) Transcript_54025:89-781(-)